MKAKKGKKQETVRLDLTHILGYTGTDLYPVGPPSPVGSEKEAAGMHSIPLRLMHCDQARLLDMRAEKWRVRVNRSHIRDMHCLCAYCQCQCTAGLCLQP